MILQGNKYKKNYPLLTKEGIKGCFSVFILPALFFRLYSPPSSFTFAIKDSARE
jgi:hypothetical protein